jgi:hypothetical protein
MIPFYGSATELIRLLATVLVALTPFAQPLDASPTHHVLSDQRVQSPTRFELLCSASSAGKVYLEYSPFR